MNNLTNETIYLNYKSINLIELTIIFVILIFYFIIVVFFKLVNYFQNE